MNLKSIIEEQFGFLYDYGFTLTTNDYGRELFFNFDRGAETISISIEVGSFPIVEIFCPATQINGESIPWAEKDGVQRGRRFPKLEVGSDCSDIPKLLQEMADQLAVREKAWLEQTTK